jgi:hypothetical protein
MGGYGTTAQGAKRTLAKTATSVKCQLRISTRFAIWRFEFG